MAPRKTSGTKTEAKQPVETKEEVVKTVEEKPVEAAAEVKAAPAGTKSAAKKPAEKKPAAKKPAEKKPVEKKPAAKKAAEVIIQSELGGEISPKELNPPHPEQKRHRAKA